MGVPMAALTVVDGASKIVNDVQNLFGGSSRFASAPYEGAEAARANAALAGIAAGSVESARYLLGQHQSDTSSFAQQYTAQAIATATSRYPQIMQQAQAMGAEHDEADGFNVLSILIQLNLPFNDRWAGYSTNTGSPPSGQTAQIVTQLAKLQASAPATGTGIPGLTSLGKSSVPVLLGLGLAFAYVVSRPTKRAD